MEGLADYNSGFPDNLSFMIINKGITGNINQDKTIRKIMQNPAGSFKIHPKLINFLLNTLIQGQQGLLANHSVTLKIVTLLETDHCLFKLLIKEQKIMCRNGQFADTEQPLT